LTRTWDRRLTVALFGVVATLYIPTALIVERFPTPSPYSGCGVDCPGNAFALFPGATAFADDVVRPVREVLVVLLLIGVTSVLVERIRSAPPLLRRALVPVGIIAGYQVLAFAVYQWARRGGSVSSGVEVLAWINLLSLPAVALSFAAGLLNRRLHVASALEGLALRLRAPAGGSDVRGRIAEVLEDPSLRIAFCVPGEPGHWVDEGGRPIDAPQEQPDRACTEVSSERGRIAMVCHDPAVAQDAKLVAAAATYGFSVVENTRLIGELRSSLRRISELETQNVGAAAAERRRIERDLHDGAQQRLLALQINLALLGERLAREAPERAAELNELTGQIDETIHDVRALAHGVAPPVLTEAGLADALVTAAQAAPLTTAVHADGIARYPPAIETTVYFCCLEALQNAVKHARGATHVTIELADDGALRFAVMDDGLGFPLAPTHGSGLENMRERLAAVGGWLTVDSHPSRGTRVTGTIPLG
jgi:signal transduction histidine kinase